MNFCIIFDFPQVQRNLQTVQHLLWIILPINYMKTKYALIGHNGIFFKHIKVKFWKSA